MDSNPPWIFPIDKTKLASFYDEARIKVSEGDFNNEQAAIEGFALEYAIKNILKDHYPITDSTEGQDKNLGIDFFLSGFPCDVKKITYPMKNEKFYGIENGYINFRQKKNECTRRINKALPRIIIPGLILNENLIVFGFIESNYCALCLENGKGKSSKGHDVSFIRQEILSPSPWQALQKSLIYSYKTRNSTI